ncbi:hypothetical protein [Tropicimonas sp. IMCC34043]|uniref:hypothetical protein n=1 Tax=Tropicimonas sp. IMCC34043 TaxID=2248760 RepID=UPI0013005AA4|nr:hypothetical protein [Tropicimonas sp. IMCC34043]
MRMILAATATAIAVLTTGAHAEVPAFDAQCPGGVNVRAEAGGPVTFDGRAAEVEMTGDTTYEATRKKDTATITVHEDGSAAVSFEGGHTIGGACTLIRSSSPTESDS